MTARRANPTLANDILAVTADLIEEGGVEAVTMRKVASRVGYSPTTIYLYFENKEDLLDATVSRAFDRLADHIGSARRSSAILDRIRESSLAYVEWGLRHPAMYRLMFELTRVKPLSEETHRVRRRAWRASRSEIAEGVAEGSLPGAGDPDAAATLLWASMHGATSLAISGRLSGNGGGASSPELRERVLALAAAQADALLAAWSGACR